MEVIRDHRRISSEEIRRFSHLTEKKIFDSKVKPISYHSNDDSCTEEQHQSVGYLDRDGASVPSNRRPFLALHESANSSSGRPPLGPIARGTGTGARQGTGKGMGTGQETGTAKRAGNSIGMGVPKSNHSKDSGIRLSGVNSGEVLP